MKHVVSAISLVLALGASAITATKDYVDRATNATLSAASAYADRVGASAIESANAYADDATNELNRALYVKVKNATNALDRAISAKIEAAKPSDYETVKSNAAEAVKVETDPTVPDWAKAATSPAPGNYAAVSNKAMSAVQVETDPSVPAWAKGSSKPSYTASEVGAVPTGQSVSSFSLRSNPHFMGGQVTEFSSDGVSHDSIGASDSLDVSDIDYQAWDWLKRSGVGLGTWIDYNYLKSESDPTVPSWAKAANPPESMPDNGLVLTNGSVKTKSGTAIAASNVGAFPAASGQTLQQAVQMISVHLNAEDARDIVTNYNSAVNMPSRSLEYKELDGPNAGTWRVVWDELTRWNWLTGTYLPSNFYTKAEVDARTDHVQWGLFDSQTGNFSPDKTVQISSDRVILCKGASYQRTATASGTYFVWTSNEPYSITGVESNGYFRIEDAEGNTTFEIVKGDKVTAAATAGGVSTEDVVGITHLHIRYPIEADAHPTLEICNDLATHDWKAETDPGCKANVTWTGVSGNYTAEVWRKSAESALFIKATYERGSDPYVRYAQAIALQTVKIGNTIYYVGTATISGHTVLTLSLTPQ